MKKLFVSFVVENEGFVEKLSNDLKECGFEPWLYCVDMEYGTDIEIEIEKQIKECDKFLACFSSELLDRDESFMIRELDIATNIYRKKFPDNRWILPIKINKCEIPNIPIGFDKNINKIYHADFSENNNYYDTFERMVKNLGGDLDDIARVRLDGLMSIGNNKQPEKSNILVLKTINEMEPSIVDLFLKAANLIIEIKRVTSKKPIKLISHLETLDMRIYDFEMITNTGTTSSRTRYSKLAQYGVSFHDFLKLQDNGFINLSYNNPTNTANFLVYQNEPYFTENMICVEFPGIYITDKGKTLYNFLLSNSYLVPNTSYIKRVIKDLLKNHKTKQP